MLDTQKLTTQENINLSDTIGLVAPKATPLFSMLMSRTVKAGAKYHVWREKTLDNSDATAKEGATPNFVNSGRAELSNVTQIFSKGTEVSGSAQATTETGVSDLLLSEINDRQIELAIAIEKALLNGSKNDGSNGEARKMDGLVNWIDSKNVVEADGVLNEKDIRSLAKVLFEAGNEEGEFYAFVNADAKEAIDEIFADKYSYVHETNSFGIVVSKVVTSFGTINVVLNRFAPANKIVAVNVDALKLAMLREPHYEELAKNSDSIKGMAISELTLEVASKKAVAVLNLAPAE